MRNKVIASLFMAFLLITAVNQKAYLMLGDLLPGMMKSFLPVYSELRDGRVRMADRMTEIRSNCEADLLEDLSYKKDMIRLSGSVLKATGTRSYYNNQYGMNITTSGYNVGRYNVTSTDYEVEEIKRFKDYLDARGIQLLYVSEPIKYIDDDYYTEQFGGESFINRNTDLFLSRIREEGINCFDLRDCIRREGLDPMQMFYRTDHHWTVPASKWAAERIARKLNEDYGYHIDLSLYDDERFDSVLYEKCWLGEQGRKVADTYIGLDDYTMMEPLYDTSFCVIDSEGQVSAERDFGLFIDKTVYEEEVDHYDARSWHYSYRPYKGRTIQNNFSDYGNILVLGDSYESSMLPFLTLGVKNVKLVVLREIEGSVRDIVEAGDYDTVIIAYAQHIIGAHDNETNSNYRMFTLD